MLGLLTASIISRRNLRGAAVFRSLLFVPQVVTTVVTAVVWKYLYTPDGPINSLLRALGLARWRRTGSATSPGRCPRSASSARG